MRTIKSKIIAAVIITISMILVLFGYIIYGRIIESDMSALDARLTGYADKLRSEFEEGDDENPSPDIASMKSIHSEYLGSVHFRLADSIGRVVYEDSLFAPVRTQFDLSKNIFYENISLGFEDYRSFTVRIETERRDRYLLQVIAPLSELNIRKSHLKMLMGIAIPVTLIIVASLVYLIVSFSFRPISTMISTAESLSAQSLHQRIELPRTKNEVYTLVIALNRMIGRIESAFISQKQFIADASHEIRTPLTILRSEIEYADRNSTNQKAKESLDIALIEIDRLTKLTSDLLVLARIEQSESKMEFSSIPLHSILTDTVREMAAAARIKNVILQLSIKSTEPISGNEQYIKSVFINILDNAIKYSNERSTIDISLSKSKDSLVVSVVDSGIGISADELPLIFNRFYRGSMARSGQNGSGLGLSVVSRIMEMHNGSIRIESTINKGTRVTIEFPARRTL